MRGIQRLTVTVVLSLALLVSLTASWLIDPASANAATRYVATGGNDESGANECLEQDSPCATLEQAIKKATSGDTIQIGPGEYHEAIETTVELHLVGAASSGSERTLLVSSGESVPGVWMKASGSLEHLALSDDFSGIGGDLRTEDGNVTANDIAVRTDPKEDGTDAIAVGGGSFSMSHSTAEALNSDEVVENSVVSHPTEGTPVLNDGSGIEISGGEATIVTSTLSAQRGMALRVHGTASSVDVRDSVVSVGGEEDLTGAGSGGDGWPAIEAGSGPLELVGDTVYNATLGGAEEARPPADALLAEPGSGVEILLDNTIVRAQEGGFGTDIDTWRPVSGDHASFTTTTVNGTGNVPAADSGGNIPGNPQFQDAAAGNLALAAGSPLVGAGDPMDVLGTDTDVTGASRELGCAQGLDVLNIGAYETAAPQCPAGPPTLEPGAHSYLYIEHGVGSEGYGYEQLLLGEGGLLGKLEPFEAHPVHTVAGTIVSGADASQLYAFEQGVLQQYQIEADGQLAAAATIEAPHGSSFGGAALSADGHDLYIVLSTGSAPSKVVEVTHERVDASGNVTQAGTPLVLPSGTAGARLALDQTGHLFVLANHEAAKPEEATATLYDYRPNPDGTLTAEDSVALEHTGTALTVAPDGSEAVVTRYSFAVLGSGQLYPFKVLADGALSAQASVASGVQGAGEKNNNNPTGAVFSPDSKTLFVANEDETEGFESVVTHGSIVSPFAVLGDGSLRPQTPTPNPEAGGLPNGYEFESGLAISPDGKSLYAPNDKEEPTAGAIDQFTIGTEGALTPKTPEALSGDPYQGSLAVVTPPGSGAVKETKETETGGGSKEEAKAPGGGTVVLAPPPPPPAVTQGIAGQVTGGPAHTPVSGAQVSACPRAHLLTGACVGTTTDASGHYTVVTGPGVWLVQVEPPDSSLFPASVEVTVTPGAQTTQNFALSAPQPVSKGVTFQTPTGSVSSGVPTVNWATPFSFDAPAGAPKHERPGTTLLVSRLLGLTSNTSSSQGKAFNMAGVIFYGVHYNATGKPAGMTEPVVGEIACGASCSRLAGTGSSTKGPGIVLAHGQGSATLVVVQSPEGHQTTLSVTYFYTPGLVSGPDPLEDVSVDLGPNVPTGSGDLEKTLDDDESELEKDPEENHADATHIDDGEDDIDVDVSSIGEGTHGGGNWFDDEDRGLDGKQSTADSDKEVDVYGPDETRLDEDETAADEEAVLDSVERSLQSRGEPPLDDEEAAMVLSALDGYVEEAGSLDLKTPSEEDSEKGLADYLQQAEDEISALDLPQAYKEILFNALADDAPRLFPNTVKQIEEEEEAEDQEARELEAEERKREREEGDEPDDEPPYGAFGEGEDDEDDDGSIFWDPSGVVESTGRVPLAGATVTLTRAAKPHARQLKVPNGSDVMSPANRRNPSRSTLAGLFDWDTIPGYYQISARHSGCKPAHTSVFAVPPPRANLVLKLRCRPIRRQPTRMSVRVVKSRSGTLVLKVAVSPKRGRSSAERLLGTVTIDHAGKPLIAVALDASARALVDLPGKPQARQLQVTYSGNALFAPSSQHG